MAAGESITDAFGLAVSVPAVIIDESRDSQNKMVQRLIMKRDKQFVSSSAYENIIEYYFNLN